MEDADCHRQEGGRLLRVFENFAFKNLGYTDYKELNFTQKLS